MQLHYVDTMWTGEYTSGNFAPTADYMQTVHIPLH